MGTKIKQTKEQRYKEFKDALDAFWKDSCKDNSRYKSWEYCYEQFYRARDKELEEKDYELLSLHLSFYLASWGMFRNSFLLERDYKIHINVIKEILNPRYKHLFGIDCDKLDNENWELLQELIGKDDEGGIRGIYSKIRKEVYKEVYKMKPPKEGVSDILITKVLMGTLGCVPAYDRYFKNAVAGIVEIKKGNKPKEVKFKRNIASKSFSQKSINNLVSFYKTHNEDLESKRETMKIADDIEYPQMKLLDMGFWKLGLEDKIEFEKTNKQLINLHPESDF